MATRNLDLIPRVEDVREARPVALPVQFSLEEIKQHFDDSLNGIKGQYLVADLLIQNGNEVGGGENDLAVTSCSGRRIAGFLHSRDE